MISKRLVAFLNNRPGIVLPGWVVHRFAESIIKGATETHNAKMHAHSIAVAHMLECTVEFI